MSNKAAQIVNGIEQLFSLPNVCLRVVSMAQSDDYSAIDIAHEIGKDPHLTAQVLRLANSAFYSFPSRIDTITRAIMVIGMKELANLVLGLGFISSSRNRKPTHIDVDEFWRHCLFVGLLSRRLGAVTAIRVLHRDRLFTAGVLHDIGQLIMDYKIPELMAVMIDRAQKCAEPFHVTQRLIFDTDYADTGAELLKSWKLPVSLQTILRFQNSPENAGSQTVEAAIVHIANHYAIKEGYLNSGIETKEQLNPFVWKITGLTERLVTSACTEASQEISTYLPYFIESASPKKAASKS